MLIHTLKYGILASKGHAVSVPQNSKFYTQLPLLPDKVGLLVLKSWGCNSKWYIASHSKVQDALEGLIFGVPKYGVAVPFPGFKQYNGRDHISGITLNGKYFQYPPNNYYYDVHISQERLNSIPENPSLYDVPSVDL